jgi:hypothetical protein
MIIRRETFVLSRHTGSYARTYSCLFVSDFANKRGKRSSDAVLRKNNLPFARQSTPDTSLVFEIRKASSRRACKASLRAPRLQFCKYKLAGPLDAQLHRPAGNQCRAICYEVHLMT